MGCTRIGYWESAACWTPVAAVLDVPLAGLILVVLLILPILPGLPDVLESDHSLRGRLGDVRRRHRISACTSAARRRHRSRPWQCGLRTSPSAPQAAPIDWSVIAMGAERRGDRRLRWSSSASLDDRQQHLFCPRMGRRSFGDRESGRRGALTVDASRRRQGGRPSGPPGWGRRRVTSSVSPRWVTRVR
jgi:hypothetical protein